MWWYPAPCAGAMGTEASALGSPYGLYIGLAVDHAAAMNCINVLLVADSQTVCMPAAMLVSTGTAVVGIRYGC